MAGVAECRCRHCVVVLTVFDIFGVTSFGVTSFGVTISYKAG